MNKNIIVLTYKENFTTSSRLEKIKLKVNSVAARLRWPPVRTINQISFEILPDWGEGWGCDPILSRLWFRLILWFFIVTDKVISALTTSRTLLLQLRLSLFNSLYLSDFDSDSDNDSASDSVYDSDSSYYRYSKLQGQLDFNSVSDSDLGQIFKLKQVNWSLQQEKW